MASSADQSELNTWLAERRVWNDCEGTRMPGCCMPRSVVAIGDGCNLQVSLLGDRGDPDGVADPLSFSSKNSDAWCSEGRVAALHHTSPPRAASAIRAATVTASPK